MNSANGDRSLKQYFLTLPTDMFALRAWRSPLLAASRRPLLVANSSQIASTNDNAPLVKLLTSLDTTTSEPPTPGPDGYPLPSPPNPFSAKDLKDYALVKPKYRLHCQSTRNNTITTLTQPNGQTIAWFSGGSCGFKKVNRSSYEAGYQCAVRMFKRIEEFAKGKDIELELFFKGFGQGRDALHRALMTTEGELVRPMVVSITDRTAIKIGGTRAKKARRL